MNTFRLVKIYSSLRLSRYMYIHVNILCLCTLYLSDRDTLAHSVCDVNYQVASITALNYVLLKKIQRDWKVAITSPWNKTNQNKPKQTTTTKKLYEKVQKQLFSITMHWHFLIDRFIFFSIFFAAVIEHLWIL